MTWPVAVVRQHTLDLLILLPANVTLVVLGTQHQPLLRRFLALAVSPLACHKLCGRFRLAIGIGACIAGMGQDPKRLSMVRPPPAGGTVGRPDRNLQTVSLKPHQGLPRRAALENLAKAQRHSWANPPI